jgi:hypothetical protein
MIASFTPSGTWRRHCPASRYLFAPLLRHAARRHPEHPRLQASSTGPPACHDGQVISYAASLRVYEPLRAFPEPERALWTEYVARGLAVDPVTGATAEHDAGLAAAIRVPPTGAPDAGDELVFVRARSGVTYVCPARTRLRCWQALSEFRASMPEIVAGAFVPLAAIENAENALEKWLAEHPDRRSHVQSVTFQVPLRWLLLVDAGERELVLGPRFDRPAEGSAADVEPEQRRRCAYLTTMAQARKRAARALNVVRRTVEDGPVVAGVEGVARWLEEFHPHAMVELDYGGLVHLVDDERLTADESPALVARALQHLDGGDTEAAGEAYESVMSYWHDVQAFETVN